MAKRVSNLVIHYDGIFGVQVRYENVKGVALQNNSYKKVVKSKEKVYHLKELIKEYN